MLNPPRRHTSRIEGVSASTRSKVITCVIGEADMAAIDHFPAKPSRHQYANTATRDSAMPGRFAPRWAFAGSQVELLTRLCASLVVAFTGAPDLLTCLRAPLVTPAECRAPHRPRYHQAVPRYAGAGCTWPGGPTAPANRS